MPRRVTSTCLATLRNGVSVSSQDEEDKEHLTLNEEILEPDSDGDDPAEEDENEDDDYENIENVFKRFLMSSHCTVCLYLGLTLIIVGSMIGLIVIAVQVVLPFEEVRGFISGMCIPKAVMVNDSQMCMCGAGCSAQYQCLSIKVKYQDTDKVWRNATLYENESILGKQCSFYPPCKNSPTKIKEAVETYGTRFGVIGLPYNCFYDPGQGSRFAIRTKRFRLYHLVNGILWTSIILIMTCIALSYSIKKRGCHFC